MSSTPTNGFERVLAKFSSRLTRDEVENFRFSTLEEVHQAIIDIQDQQARRKGMRNLTRVLSFVEAMDQFGKVVEVFLNSSSLLPFIWGPIKFLLQVASTWAESFDTLLDAYQEISENIPLLLQYQTLFQQSPAMANVLEMMYEDILEFHQCALRVFSKSTLQQLFRAAWKNFKSRFQHILDDLQRHKTLIESQANILQIQQAQAARIANEKAFEKISIAERHEQYVVVQNWLSAVNTKVDHEGFAAMRLEYPSTGQWVLNKEAVKVWLNPDNSAVPIVWLQGIPGAGKTILTSLIIEEAQRQSLVSVLYFYCKHKDPQRNTFVAVARALLAQLLVQNRAHDLLPFLHEEYLDSGEITLQSIQLCKTLLKTALESLPADAKIYIVIDGIDECDIQERRNILSTLTSIIEAGNHPGRLRGMFVSQDEPDIKSLLRTSFAMRITETDNEEDIREYARCWALKIRDRFKLPPDKVDHIMKTVCDRAEGMFLFTKLVLTNLYDQTTRGQLYNELSPERFPRGLNQAYGRIVERIYQNENVAQREQAQKLLGWIVCAKRPLKWNEIQAAMSINPEQQSVDFEERQLVLDVSHLCGSLVERLPGDRIELVHSTAKIYLVQDCYIRLPKEEGKLAALCLQYLTFESFFMSISRSNDEIVQDVKTGLFAFQDYAVLHWADHLQSFWTTLGPEDLHYLDFLGPISEDFLALYGPEDQPESEEHLNLEVKCAQVMDSTNFETFQILMNHARQLRTQNEDITAIGKLGSSISRIRLVMEGLFQSDTAEAVLRQRLYSYYGSNWFKCPRHLCFYFHEGFSDLKRRDHHISRHDRPFCCSHVGCSRVQTGFSTEKELKLHLRKNHPDPESLSWKFPKPKKLADANAKRFVCRVCPKKFTRAYSLRVHEQSHTDERPFGCTVCGKTFLRKHDRKIHEKLHSGEKNFVCKGGLEQGRQWGCGRRFARTSSLGRHFRSEAGRICINPLRDEEAAKQERLSKGQQNIQLGEQPPEYWPSMDLNVFQVDSNDNYNIPEAILTQYPSLRTLDWSELPQGDVGLDEETAEGYSFDAMDRNTEG